VVIAENIERIYKQNCQNLGLLTSTNFSLIDRIRGGEEIELREFTAGEDEITRQVIEYGGLFPFNVARMQGKVFLPPLERAGRVVAPTRAMTLAEKIFARHMINEAGEVGVASVKRGDTRFCACRSPLRHEYVTPMAAIFFERYVGKDAKVNDPESILFFRDHLTFLGRGDFRGKRKSLDCWTSRPNSNSSRRISPRNKGIRLHGELKDRKGSEGICHSIVLERLRAAGAVKYRLGFAHSACGRDWLRWPLHRYHRRI